MSPLRLNGSTSGNVSLDAPAVSGNNTLTLPTGNGTAGQVLTTNGSGALSFAPAVRQVVQATRTTYFGTLTTIPLDDTVPQNTEGAEFLTASITLNSTSSKVLVRVVVNHTNDNVNYINGVGLFRDSVTDALAFSWGRIPAVNNPAPPLVIEYLDSPATISSITYKLRGGTAGGTGAQTFQVNGGSGTRYFGGSLNTCITLLEVTP